MPSAEKCVAQRVGGTVGSLAEALKHKFHWFGPQRRAQQAVAERRDLLILGTSGSGKSTLLTELHNSNPDILFVQLMHSDMERQTRNKSLAKQTADAAAPFRRRASFEAEDLIDLRTHIAEMLQYSLGSHNMRLAPNNLIMRDPLGVFVQTVRTHEQYRNTPIYFVVDDVALSTRIYAYLAPTLTSKRDFHFLLAAFHQDGMQTFRRTVLGGFETVYLTPRTIDEFSTAIGGAAEEAKVTVEKSAIKYLFRLSGGVLSTASNFLGGLVRNAWSLGPSVTFEMLKSAYEEVSPDHELILHFRPGLFYHTFMISGQTQRRAMTKMAFCGSINEGEAPPHALRELIAHGIIKRNSSGELALASKLFALYVRAVYLTKTRNCSASPRAAVDAALKCEPFSPPAPRRLTVPSKPLFPTDGKSESVWQTYGPLSPTADELYRAAFLRFGEGHPPAAMLRLLASEIRDEGWQNYLRIVAAKVNCAIRDIPLSPQLLSALETGRNLIICPRHRRESARLVQRCVSREWKDVIFPTTGDLYVELLNRWLESKASIFDASGYEFHHVKDRLAQKLHYIGSFGELMPDPLRIADSILQRGGPNSPSQFNILIHDLCYEAAILFIAFLSSHKLKNIRIIIEIPDHKKLEPFYRRTIPDYLVVNPEPLKLPDLLTAIDRVLVHEPIRCSPKLVAKLYEQSGGSEEKFCSALSKALLAYTRPGGNGRLARKR